MSKEIIMEEFDKQLLEYLNCDVPKKDGTITMSIRDFAKNYFSSALDQVRLETIREVDGLLPNEREIGLSGCTECSDYTNSFNDCLNQIKDLINKLK